MRIAVIEKGSSRSYCRLVDDTTAIVFDRAPWLGGQETSEKVSWQASELRAPVAPSKVVCVGRNYAAHAKELGNEVPSEPLLFLKPPSSVIGPGEFVVIPRSSSRVEHESELGVVVGKRARNVSPEEALSYVYGYTAVCDVTARDLQRKDVQFTRAKGFDTFCPVGPWVETELDVLDVEVSCIVSGAVKQRGRTSQMVFPVATLISAMSHVMTLEPGDLLVTGTPEGVGPLVDGDELVVAIEGIGELRNRVRADT